MEVCGFPIDLTAVPLWDAHPEGRVGQVLTLAPKNQHPFLMAYFSSVEPAKCMAAELKALESDKVALCVSCHAHKMCRKKRKLDCKMDTLDGGTMGTQNCQMGRKLGAKITHIFAPEPLILRRLE